jgi:DNA-binding protein YbaB
MLDNFMQNLLQNSQNQLSEQKNKFEESTVEYISSDNKISMKLNGNFKLLDISVSSDLLNDKEMLEDFLVLNFNKAIEEVNKFRQVEAEKIQQGLMSNLGSLFNNINE